MHQLRIKNHYVPKTYLKQWATDGKVATYSLLVPNDRIAPWKHHSLKGIAFHEHLYTQIVGGTENDEFERWLDCRFEAPAEASIQRAIANSGMTKDEWRALIRFAFAQDVRTPARLRDFLRRQAKDLPTQLDQILRNAVKKLEQDRLAVAPGESVSSGFPLRVRVEEEEGGVGLLRAETVVGRKLWLWGLRHLLTSTIDKISYKGWSIRRSAPGYTWPTSDNPLIRLNYFSRYNYSLSGGWGVPNGDVLLPLSPTHIMHVCVGRRAPTEDRPLDATTTELISQIIIENADRYVFSAKAFDIQRFRQRLVDRDLYYAERRMWEAWGYEQALVERDA
ncbi:DUF4238 domain-containing protein [Luteimonas sp. A482]